MAPDVEERVRKVLAEFPLDALRKCLNASDGAILACAKVRGINLTSEDIARVREIIQEIIRELEPEPPAQPPSEPEPSGWEP